MRIRFLHLLLILAGNLCAEDLQVSTFTTDITPPIGSPLCFSYIKPARTVEEPLTARGLVIFGKEKPVVLCVADFVVIANASHDAWKEALASAAGTTPDRVAMHVIHNHDSPGYDLSAAIELEAQGLPDVMALKEAHDQAIADTADAVREAVQTKTPVTHIGLGTGTVEKFASNRRIIGESGNLVMTRMSASRNAEAKAEPEGTIDPDLNLIAFWDGGTPVAALTFYASHPQSYYGKGGVTPDTVGLARNRRTEETGALHIHFDGAGGNVAAGKYNDGSPEARVELTCRAHAGMELAWERQRKIGVGSDDFEWTVSATEFPWRGLFTEEQLRVELSNPETSVKDRIRAARDLVYWRRWKEGSKIDVGCLRLGDARALFFPGELFVEYQLAAKAMRPDHFVAVAAYGDGGPGYIGTAISYEEGGYEVSRVSRTAPSVESILTKVTRQLLEAE
ncbi:MAG: hypothetical protein P1U81_11090 [Verrucomicrobiales bacterium]|jgi:hypothetical protein|nr:hypothetical protein [Verrucomicrobiales bacterium]